MFHSNFFFIAEAELPPCSLGARGCHVTTQTKTRSLINAQDLTHTDRRLLSLRSGRPQGDIRTVCSHHYQVYLKKYTSLIASKWCSNPFYEHVKNRRGSAVITIALADAHPNLNLIPGNRLCQACRRNCFELKKRPTFQAPPPPLARDAPSEQDDPDVALESVNEALAAVGESPLQRKRGRTSRETYAQKKVRKLKISAERRIYTSLGIADDIS